MRSDVAMQARTVSVGKEYSESVTVEGSPGLDINGIAGDIDVSVAMTTA